MTGNGKNGHEKCLQIEINLLTSFMCPLVDDKVLSTEVTKVTKAGNDKILSTEVTKAGNDTIYKVLYHRGIRI
jgi:hypothetical protein